jgi:hypothetical protein
MWINTVTNQYPLFEADIRAHLPNTSFGQPFTPPEPYEWVAPTPMPDFDTIGERARELPPAIVAGTWRQRWEVVALSAEQAAANQQAQTQRVKVDIVAATQARLDTFARERNYDDIKSASDYAGCSVPKFSQEGTYCRDARAETWAKLYDMLAEVQAGTRPMPTGFADIEPELPPLVWPTPA